MRSPTRIAIINVALLAFVALLIVRAAQVQLFQADQWEQRAARQQVTEADLPAPRGAILDAEGTPLAQNVEMVTLRVAPREVRDRARLAKELRRLKVAPDVVKKATDPSRKWLVIPGRFAADDVTPLRRMRGVHPLPFYHRWYSQRSSTRQLLGRLASDGAGSDGLELALDELLAGSKGTRTLVRDALGRKRASPIVSDVLPEPGHDVTLTISEEWQEIAERALRSAIDSMGAEGGDMVVVDPKTGAIRALAAVRRGSTVWGAPALIEPFEPGSTLKPVIAAALLQSGRATPADKVEVGKGVLTIAGRTITDTHVGEPVITLSEVIVESSNVGIARFAQRLTPVEQWQWLRDFGFGTPTGLPYPSESSGRLRHVKDWQAMSPVSHAIGYEMSVTALQLAMAYAAFANGGELLEPALVQEIRGPDGAVRFRHDRRVVRRVIEPAVAREVMAMLRATVAEGTATAAGVGDYQVAGKTGTARRASGRGYQRGEYIASFVGMFPADDPQMVIVVKLDNPSGAYYGGLTAAPVFRHAVHAALATRGATLDRGRLAQRPPEPAAPVESGAPPAPVAAAPGDAEDEAPAPPVRVALPVVRQADTAAAAPRPVPDVRGLPMRDAVAILHRAGFRVRVAGSGMAGGTSPAAGTAYRAGGLVRLAGAP